MSKRTKTEPTISTKKKTMNEKKKIIKDLHSIPNPSSSLSDYKTSIPKDISTTISSRLRLILTEPRKALKEKLEKDKQKICESAVTNIKEEDKNEKCPLTFDPTISHHRVFSDGNTEYTLLEAILLFGRKKLIKLLKCEISDSHEDADRENFPSSATLFYAIVKKDFSNITDLFLDYYSEIAFVNSIRLRKLKIREEVERQNKEKEREIEKLKKTLFGENISICDEDRCNRAYVERYIPYFMKKVKGNVNGNGYCNNTEYKLPDINYNYESTILVMSIVDETGYLNLFKDIEDLCFEVKGECGDESEKESESDNWDNDVPETNVFILKDTNMGGEISFSLTHLMMKFDYFTILNYLLRISDINHDAVKGYLEAMRCIIYLKSSFPAPLNGLKDFFVK